MRFLPLYRVLRTVADVYLMLTGLDRVFIGLLPSFRAPQFFFARGSPILIRVVICNLFVECMLVIWDFLLPGISTGFFPFTCFMRG